MKYLLTARRAMLLATTCALLQHGGLVLAEEGAGSVDSVPVVGTRPAMNALTPQPVPPHCRRPSPRARTLALERAATHKAMLRN
jgi:hypothetical protein